MHAVRGLRSTGLMGIDEGRSTSGLPTALLRYFNAEICLLLINRERSTLRLMPSSLAACTWLRWQK